MYSVLPSATFKRQFRKLHKNEQDRMRRHLYKLQDNPKKKRVGMDIKKNSDTIPPKYRLRVGEDSIIYRIEGDIVKLIEIFPRGRGYR